MSLETAIQELTQAVKANIEVNSEVLKQLRIFNCQFDATKVSDPSTVSAELTPFLVEEVEQTYKPEGFHPVEVSEVVEDVDTSVAEQADPVSVMDEREYTAAVTTMAGELKKRIGNVEAKNRFFLVCKEFGADSASKVNPEARYEVIARLQSLIDGAE